MPVKRVTPQEANGLLENGYQYVDVRSIPEFDAGHPKGAYNIPLMHFLPGRGMTPNQEFTQIFQKSFAPDAKVVVGCKTGGRSLRAAELLAGLGFTQVIDMQGGFEGERDMTGRSLVDGWQGSGLPVAAIPEPGRSYEELKK